VRNLRERSHVPTIPEHPRHQSWRGQEEEEEEEGVSKSLGAVTRVKMKGTSERQTLHRVELACNLGRAGPCSRPS